MFDWHPEKKNWRMWVRVSYRIQIHYMQHLIYKTLYKRCLSVWRSARSWLDGCWFEFKHKYMIVASCLRSTLITFITTKRPQKSWVQRNYFPKEINTFEYEFFKFVFSSTKKEEEERYLLPRETLNQLGLYSCDVQLLQKLHHKLLNEKTRSPST